MLEAFTAAIVTAVTVTLDPEAVYFVGRLRPLVDDALPQVRRRLEQSLSTVPDIKAVPQVLGLSTAREAVYACSAMAQTRLRESVLDVSQHPTGDGELYLCAIKDACSHRIVGYSIDSRMTPQLVDALINACASRRPARTVVTQ